MEPLSRSEKIAQAHKGYYNPRKFYNNSTSSQKTYDSWNGQEKGFEARSFQIRLVIASFLFLAFLGLKETGKDFYDISCEKVVEIVTDNQGMEAAEEKIISVFYQQDEK